MVNTFVSHAEFKSSIQSLHLARNDSAKIIIKDVHFDTVVVWLFRFKSRKVTIVVFVGSASFSNLSTFILCTTEIEENRYN